MKAGAKAVLAGCASTIALLAIPAAAGATTGTFVPTTPGPNAVPAVGDSGSAATNPWNFVVSGLPGLTNDVNLALTGVSHLNPTDLDALLVAPNGGGGVVVLSDIGDDTDAAGVDLTIDDQALTGAPVGADLVSGSYKPTDNDVGDSGDGWTAPAGPVGTSLSFVDGFNPNGTWSLYLSDDDATVSPSTGVITNASLTVSTHSSGQPPTLTNPNAGPKPKKCKRKKKARQKPKKCKPKRRGLKKGRRK